MDSTNRIREALLAADPQAGSMYLQDMTFKITVDIYAASMDLFIKANVDAAVEEVENRRIMTDLLEKGMSSTGRPARVVSFGGWTQPPGLNLDLPDEEKPHD